MGLEKRGKYGTTEGAEAKKRHGSTYQRGMRNGRECPRHQYVEPVHGAGYWDVMVIKENYAGPQGTWNWAAGRDDGECRAAVDVTV